MDKNVQNPLMNENYSFYLLNNITYWNIKRTLYNSKNKSQKKGLCSVQILKGNIYFEEPWNTLKPDKSQEAETFNFHWYPSGKPIEI